jgi:hypothetical protein
MVKHCDEFPNVPQREVQGAPFESRLSKLDSAYGVKGKVAELKLSFKARDEFSKEELREEVCIVGKG